MAKVIDNGTYATVYKIGDLVPLDMGSEGQINMQIAAFDADDLADGSGKAPISWISKELLKTSKRWNPARVTNDDGTYQEGTGSVGGWGKSELRTYYNETLLPLIPEEVRNQIVSVTKTQTAYDTANASFNQITEETVWLPSYPEMYGMSSLYYGLFKNNNANRIKKKVGASSASGWFLRSPFGSSSNVYYISSNGDFGSTATHQTAYSHPICFCT